MLQKSCTSWFHLPVVTRSWWAGCNKGDVLSNQWPALCIKSPKKRPSLRPVIYEDTLKGLQNAHKDARGWNWGPADLLERKSKTMSSSLRVQWTHTLTQHNQVNNKLSDRFQIFCCRKMSVKSFFIYSLGCFCEQATLARTGQAAMAHVPSLSVELV